MLVAQLLNKRYHLPADKQRPKVLQKYPNFGLVALGRWTFVWLLIVLLHTVAVGQDVRYRKHKVKAGEDLMTIARLYSVNVGQLLKANPGTIYQELARGEIIYIPEKKPTQLNDGTRKIKGYRVKAGETLHGICQRFRMDIQQIRALNQLKSDELHPGQKLLVITAVRHNDFFEVPAWMLQPASARPKERLHLHKVASGETLYSIARQYGVTEGLIREQNDLEGNNIRVGQTLRIRVSIEPAEPNTRIPQEILEDLVPEPAPLVDDKITEPEVLIHESGIGVRIRQRRASDQKIALHRSAEIGSFIRVHNESNGSYCTVRVIGHFPDIEANKKVLIKISEAACQQLGLVNDRFPIVISRPGEK